MVPCKHAAHLVHHITWRAHLVKLQRHPEFGVQLVPDVSAWADTTLKFIRCWIVVHWEMMTLRLTVIPFFSGTLVHFPRKFARHFQIKTQLSAVFMRRSECKDNCTRHCGKSSPCSVKYVESRISLFIESLMRITFNPLQTNYQNVRGFTRQRPLNRLRLAASNLIVAHSSREAFARVCNGEFSRGNRINALSRHNGSAGE